MAPDFDLMILPSEPKICYINKSYPDGILINQAGYRISIKTHNLYVIISWYHWSMMNKQHTIYILYTQYSECGPSLD